MSRKGKREHIERKKASKPSRTSPPPLPPACQGAYPGEIYWSTGPSVGANEVVWVDHRDAVEGGEGEREGKERRLAISRECKIRRKAVIEK